MIVITYADRMELEAEQGGATQGQQAMQLAHKSYPPGIVDAYTHFAPPGLLAFLQQHSEGPLVFAKVRAYPLRPSPFLRIGPVSVRCLVVKINV